MKRYRVDIEGFHADVDGEFVLAEEALAEVERLRAELDSALLREQSHKPKWECSRCPERARLADEVERLRAELEQCERWLQHNRVRLAAANALLTVVRDDPLQQRKAWHGAIVAHLAGQAAAPSRTTAEQRDTSRDTSVVWYDPKRGYIFRDTEPAPENARREAK